MSVQPARLSPGAAEAQTLMTLRNINWFLNADVGRVLYLLFESSHSGSWAAGPLVRLFVGV